MRFAQFNERCWTGYQQAGMKKKGHRQVPNCVPVTENRRDPADLYKPSDSELDRLHHVFVPAWSLLDHDELTIQYDFVDDDTALEFVTGLYHIEQELDHNAVITLDNAQVTVTVRTSDVDGLTRLDFEFALLAQDLAQEFAGDPVPHATNQVDENLRDWFKDKWVRFGPDGKIRGDCARGSESEGKPKCLPQSKAHALGKKGRASAAARKRRQDPDANRSGAAINVSTKGKKK